MGKARTVSKWDLETEVVVVGYGLAGAVSAVCAHDAGAKVLILEKSKTPGGSSALAGGMVKVAVDVEGAKQYLSHTQGERCDSSLIEVMAQGMHEIPEFLKTLAKVDQAELSSIITQAESAKAGRVSSYPFPGRKSLGSIAVTRIPGFKEFPWVQGTQLNGQRLVKLLIDNVEARGIEVLLSSTARELVTGEDGRVVGLVAEKDGKRVTTKAKRAVILACGGFEFTRP